MKFTKPNCPNCGKPMPLTKAQRVERARLAAEASRRARAKRQEAKP